MSSPILQQYEINLRVDYAIIMVLILYVLMRLIGFASDESLSQKIKCDKNKGWKKATFVMIKYKKNTKVTVIKFFFFF